MASKHNVIPSQGEAAVADAETVELVVPPECAGLRLDQALARLFPDVSRSRVQQWVHDERVRVDGKLRRVRDTMRGGETVTVAVPAAAEGDWRAQALPLDVVYEDDTLLVINKPPGLVVHPGAGNPEGTLLNALLHRAPELRRLARAGIVHRLDKETSGLMVVARTEAARLDLIEQLSARSVAREYLALVAGTLIAGGTVDAPIGRHPRERTRMAVHASGREAVSHYRVEKRYRAHTLVRVTLESGRTHQIRVHMAHLKYPVFGDPVYGGRLRLPPGASDELKLTLNAFKRQALHAAKLGLIHPASGKKMHWVAPVPDDMAALLRALAKDARAHGG